MIMLCRWLSFIFREAPTIKNTNVTCHLLWRWHKYCRPKSPSAALEASEALGIANVRSLHCYWLCCICSRAEMKHLNSWLHQGSGQQVQVLILQSCLFPLLEYYSTTYMLSSRTHCSQHEYFHGFQHASEQSLSSYDNLVLSTINCVIEWFHNLNVAIMCTV